MSEAMNILQPKYRRPSGGWRLVTVAFPAIAIVIAFLNLFHLRPFGYMLVDVSYLHVLIVAFLPLCFLWIPISNGASKKGMPWYDIVLATLSAIPSLYFISHEWEVLNLGWAMGAPAIPFMFSIILWILLIEAARRVGGPVFASIVLFFSVYPLFASYMPGFLWSPSISLYKLASFHSFSSDSIMGLILRVFGRLVLGFMIFAVVLQYLGAGKFFNDLAMVIVGNTRAGSAKVAIIASGLFGSLSGAPQANVMTTGTFTIPAMKREGLPPHFAGAVEAAASAGGALMPPVMGSAAFIMAEFLGVPYSAVVIAAVVPSILYYVCLFTQIDCYAGRVKLRPAPIVVEVPSIWRILVNNLHIILSFILLIVILFLFRLASQGPYIATGLAIMIAMSRKETRINLRGFVGMFEETGKVLGELMGILCPIGLILGSLIISGVAYSLPNGIVNLAGENAVLMLIFGAIASFILGMGMSISGVYIFLAIVLAPGLVEAGFDIMGVHLFVLYTAMFSHITPPVAISAFVAATISGASPMKTGFTAMKLGIAKYILPFVFISNPALILRAPATEILLVIPTVFIALVFISAALEGYFWRMGNLTLLSRVLLFAAGMLLAIPSLSTDLYGLGIIVVFFTLVYFLRGKSPLIRIFARSCD